MLKRLLASLFLHQAIPVVTIFNSMRFILPVTPTAVKCLAEAAVSVRRLKVPDPV